MHLSFSICKPLIKMHSSAKRMIIIFFMDTWLYFIGIDRLGLKKLHLKKKTLLMDRMFWNAWFSKKKRFKTFDWRSWTNEIYQESRHSNEGASKCEKWYVRQWFEAYESIWGINIMTRSQCVHCRCVSMAELWSLFFSNNRMTLH